jgi:spore germination protein
MEIYVVQEGDTGDSIAARFGISVEKLVIDNGLDSPDTLSVGQALVIAYPKQSHIVEIGDNLESIANEYNVTVMQLLRNNPNIAERGYLEPGEILTISYNTSGNLITNGYIFPFIQQHILLKTLPNLTYLSVFNYSITEDLDIYMSYEDGEIIQTAKAYSTIPLLLLSVLTPQGEPDLNIAYRILLSEEIQTKILNDVTDVIKRRGYSGINLVFNLINEENLSLFVSYVQRISERLRQEGLLFFITINYQDDQINSNVDYSQLSIYADEMTFMQFKWVQINEAPAPVSNINNIESLVNKLIINIPPEIISISKPAIGYDWKLPYESHRTSIVSLTIHSAFDLAYNTNSIIQFDEVSMTPYFTYIESGTGFPSMHIVWFVDARSINALLELIKEKGLGGSGLWNVMVYNAQLWLLINSQFEIIKISQ